MSKFEVGDRIRATSSMSTGTDNYFYNKGDVGFIIKKADNDNDYRVNFNNRNNPMVLDDGIWYINFNRMEHY